MFRRSIGSRFTAIYIIIGLIPILIVGTILGLRAFNSEQEQAINLQGELADRVGIEIQNLIGGLEREIQLLIELQDIHESSPEEQVQALSGLRFFNSNFDELSVIDNTGQEVAQSSRFRTGTDELPLRAEEDLYHIPASSGNTWFSPIRLDQNTGEPLMTIAIPFTNPRTRNFAGVLVASARIRNLGDILGAIPLDANDDVYVLDSNGRVIAHRDLGIVLSGPEFEVTGDAENRTGLQGADVIVVSHEVRLGNQEFTVVVENAVGDIQENAINTVLIIAGIVLLVALIAVVIGIRSIRQVVRPIQELVNVAQAIESGDLDQKAVLAREDELGILSNSFNSMTDRLRENIEGLEARVQERTSDLETITDNLRDANLNLEAAKREADDANRLKSEFLATMSHELRTPLNAIMGYTQIILQGMTGDINDLQRDQLDRVFVNSTNLLELINQILDLAKIEAGRMEVIRKPFGIEKMVADVEFQMKNLVDEKNLDFITDIAPNVPEEIVSDAGHIKQIMVNLVSNAIKFTTEGSITLNIDLDAARENWVIHVKDTGAGIPSHMIDSIFEEFRQVDGSSKRKEGGTGLGLSIVQRLVNLMNGTVRLESQVQKGSTFIVTLPLETEETPAEEV
jgi:signal transduction histidine kinase